MSDMKIPPNLGNSSPYLHSPESLPKASPLSSSEETRSSSSISPAREKKISDIEEGAISPVKIPEPEPVEENTLMYLLTVLGDATFEIGRAKEVAQIRDLDVRSKMTELVVEQAGLISSLSELRSDSYLTIMKEATAEVLKLQKLFNMTEVLNEMQQEQIDRINSGNSEELRAFGELVAAYETYIENLESIGATKQPDGTYSIPSDKIEEYNAFTAEFIAAVETFTAYWDVRLNEIDEYNQTVDSYNKKAEKINNALEDIALRYNMEPFPKIPYLEPRETTGYDEPIETPPLLPVPPPPVEGEAPPPPVSVTVPELPDYIYDIAANGPPVIDSVIPYPITEADIYFDMIYLTLYVEAVMPIDRQLQSFSQFWSFLSSVTSYAKQNEEEKEALLNDKPILFQLYEIIQEKKHVSELTAERQQNLRDLSALDAMIDKRSRLILGNDILRQIIQKDSSELSSQKIERMTDRLLTLSLGVLNSNGLTALLPSLSPVSSLLAGLPRNSPAFGILFSLSFANRLNEHAEQFTGTALEALIGEIPEFSGRASETEKKLAAGINFGLLLTSGKLLESNLGMPGLIDRLVDSVFDRTAIDKTNPPAMSDFEKTDRSVDRFIFQGFPEDEARFLSKLSLDLIQEGTLAPEISIVTPYSVNRSLLVDSLKGALILSKDHLPLAQADAIAHQAINDTLVENPRLKVAQFRRALEQNLRESGIQKNLSGIVRSVVFLPASDPSLRLSDRKEIAGESEIKESIRKKVNQLLIPQIGTKLALEISEEINLTFFGNPNPNPEEKAGNSWIDGMKRQIAVLNSEVDEEYAVKLAEAFAASIAAEEQPPLFLMNLMKPIHSMVYSIYTGTMENKGNQLMI